MTIEYSPPIKGLTKNAALWKLVSNTSSPVLYFRKPRSCSEEDFQKVLKFVREKLGVKEAK